MTKILVVDDEFDISEVLTTILHADGYAVEICSNGKEAVEHLAVKPLPALIILDVMMPFMSGYEVLRHLKGTEKLSGIPVILMSAAAPAVKQEDFGWDHFLKKPFDLDTLSVLVTKLAGKP